MNFLLRKFVRARPNFFMHRRRVRMVEMMKRITCIFLVFCLCLSLAGCGSGEEGQGEDIQGPEKVSEEELDRQAFQKAGEYLKQMTLSEKIGQMFLVDVDKLVKGEETVTAVSPELLQAIGEYKIGGVVFGKRNIQTADQITSLIRDLNQSVAAGEELKIPLYIGTEEEGGGRNSIAAATDTITSTGYVSPAEMGKNMTEGQLENTGEVIAGELIDLGFNLNFAPTADLIGEEVPADRQAVSECTVSAIGEGPEYPVINRKKISKKKKKKLVKAYQKRLQEYNAKWDAFLNVWIEDDYNSSCFGDDEEQVGEAAAAMIKGMHAVGDRGICTVLKMFPGIAPVAKYHTLVNTKIDTGLSRLRRTNLSPFLAGIQAGTDFIMVGHVALSKVDQDVPASLSETIMTDLLRSEMGFEGIIVTEQMDVPVITNAYSTEQAVVRAISSGADMVYDPEDLQAALSSVQQAVLDQKIEEEMIDQAVLRILYNKIRRGIWDPPAADDGE